MADLKTRLSYRDQIGDDLVIEQLDDGRWRMIGRVGRFRRVIIDHTVAELLRFVVSEVTRD